MVAHEKIHWYAFVGQRCQCAQQAHIAFGHYFFVFIPEIENIADDKNMRGIVLYGIEKFDDNFFPLEAGGGIRRA